MEDTGSILEMEEVSLRVGLVGEGILFRLFLLELVLEEVGGEEEVVLESLGDIVLVYSFSVILFILEYPVVPQQLVYLGMLTG